ncbi:Plp2p NDAI_0E00800 [Naumovozyma dairenensis CBS 421]|uniref:Phosducin domain-containing protein n=1 Tax=Naumovozyma dairenensis (strain ATCC 10597 / BCRC 20456 / CBS 421 / NBRC 0211 / NRRL Y-12639) TaxID=1071378 RepID=G0WAX6_NAUDC|nr:hypothetical protein NDAI_0E00800 [Naumovozyma dairenensis CBS 421]CCD24896.1 hypothetical protein NDAI_0E00800 [Naumovozyma dairenensis CBS 421]
MQNEPMFQVQVDENEDSEWNDILRSKGVIPERPPSPTAQLEEALEEAIVKQYENRLEDKDLSDLEELEDEEDEDFLEFYKMKRLNEIKQLQSKSKFGTVFHINKPEYNKEVTLASGGKDKTIEEDQDGDLKSEKEGTYVFVHLSIESKLQSRILSHIFQLASKKFPDIKFVEIPANRAIENYPDINCPTLLVYYKGDVVKNMITLLELGGNNTTLKDFEELMVRVKALDEKDSRLIMNQDDEESREQRHLKFDKKEKYKII